MEKLKKLKYSDHQKGSVIFQEDTRLEGRLQFQSLFSP